MMAVYPLLKYDPSVLAITAIVCGAKLVSSSPEFDEYLNAGTQIAHLLPRRCT